MKNGLEFVNLIKSNNSSENMPILKYDFKLMSINLTLLNRVRLSIIKK
jgi:hypothetical protein